MVTIELVRAQRFSTLKNLYVAGKQYTVSDALAEDLLERRNDDGLRYFSRAVVEEQTPADPTDEGDEERSDDTPPLPTPPEDEAPEGEQDAPKSKDILTPPKPAKKATTAPKKATKTKRGTRRKPAARNPVVKKTAAKKTTETGGETGTPSTGDDDLVEV